MLVPPEAFAAEAGWHWIKTPRGEMQPWHWSPKRVKWWTGTRFMLAEEAAGWRYWSPIAKPPYKPYETPPLFDPAVMR
jgi:hypothetical protein